MAKKKEYKVVGIEISIGDEDVKSISASLPDEYGTDIQKLSGVASALLQEQAGGGLMLTRDVMELIQQATGPIGEGADLVPWVEKAANKNGGAFVVTWKVDPTRYPVLEQIAEGQGRTVEAVMQDGLDWIIGQGWLYDFSFAETSIAIPNGEMDWLRLELGKEHVTGQDLVDYIRSMRVALPEKAA